MLEQLATGLIPGAATLIGGLLANAAAEERARKQRLLDEQSLAYKNNLDAIRGSASSQGDAFQALLASVRGSIR